MCLDILSRQESNEGVVSTDNSSPEDVNTKDSSASSGVGEQDSSNDKQQVVIANGASTVVEVTEEAKSEEAAQDLAAQQKLNPTDDQKSLSSNDVNGDVQNDKSDVATEHDENVARELIENDKTETVLAEKMIQELKVVQSEQHDDDVKNEFVTPLKNGITEEKEPVDDKNDADSVSSKSSSSTGLHRKVSSSSSDSSTDTPPVSQVADPVVVKVWTFLKHLY